MIYFSKMKILVTISFLKFLLIGASDIMLGITILLICKKTRQSKGRPPKKRIFHDIKQNPFDTYPPKTKL